MQSNRNRPAARKPRTIASRSFDGRVGHEKQLGVGGDAGDPVCAARCHCAGAGGAAVIDHESSYSYLNLNSKSVDATRPHAIHKASRRLREPRGFSHDYIGAGARGEADRGPTPRPR